MTHNHLSLVQAQVGPLTFITMNIEKLEQLPKRENRMAYLERITGGMWNSKLDRRHTDNEFYVLAERILEHNVGKSFNKAFSYFLSLTGNKHHEIILRKVRVARRWYYGSTYYIDDKYIIRKYERKKHKSKLRITDVDTGIVYEYHCKNHIYHRDKAISDSKTRKLEREANKRKKEREYCFFTEKELWNKMHTNNNNNGKQ